jgi:hypothetical protein
VKTSCNALAKTPAGRYDDNGEFFVSFRIAATWDGVIAGVIEPIFAQCDPGAAATAELLTLFETAVTIRISQSEDPGAIGFRIKIAIRSGSEEAQVSFDCPTVRPATKSSATINARNPGGSVSPPSSASGAGKAAAIEAIDRNGSPTQ